MLGRVDSQHDLPRAHEETPSLDMMCRRKDDIVALNLALIRPTHRHPPSTRRVPKPGSRARS